MLDYQETNIYIALTYVQIDKYVYERCINRTNTRTLYTNHTPLVKLMIYSTWGGGNVKSQGE
jgi:hypothetical protein